EGLTTRDRSACEQVCDTAPQRESQLRSRLVELRQVETGSGFEPQFRRGRALIRRYPTLGRVSRRRRTFQPPGPADPVDPLRSGRTNSSRNNARNTIAAADT